MRAPKRVVSASFLILAMLAATGLATAAVPSEDWTYDAYTGDFSTIYGVDADNSGNVYVGSQDNTVKKLDDTGSLV